MISKNPKDTEKIAKDFIQKLLSAGQKTKGATIVALSGELGAGKTAFTKNIAKHLGIKQKVNSPTFVIMKKYPVKKNTGYKYMFHLDAYRLKNERELMHIGWDKIVTEKEHLIFIEWPENVAKAIPRGTKKIKISHGKNGIRIFKIN